VDGDHWCLKLIGDNFDLDDYPEFFRTGELRVERQNNDYLLVGPLIDELWANGAPSKNTVRQTLDRLIAVARLQQPAIGPISAGGWICRHADGSRTHYLEGEASLGLRGKGRASIYVNGKMVDETIQGKTIAEWCVVAAINNSKLDHAIAYSADKHRTWGSLYAQLEAIEEYLGCSCSQSFCTASERRRFTQTANSVAVLGREARHSNTNFLPPSQPMTLQEATTFLDRIAQQVLLNAARALYDAATPTTSR